MNSVSQSEVDTLGSVKEILHELQYRGNKAVAFLYYFKPITIGNTKPGTQQCKTVTGETCFAHGEASSGIKAAPCKNIRL